MAIEINRILDEVRLLGCSDLHFTFPDATARQSSKSPSSSSPEASKSIHADFFEARFLFVEILTVGTKVENGVPRPVVKSTI